MTLFYAVSAIACLGNTDNTILSIFLIQLAWQTGGNPIDMATEMKVVFVQKYLGICHEGGDRLENPNSKAGGNEYLQNPSESIFTVDFFLIWTWIYRNMHL